MKIKHIDPLFTQDDLKCARAEVGILDGDASEALAKRGLKTFWGGQAMKVGGTAHITIAEVAEFNDKKYDWFDYTIENDDRALIDVTVAMAEQIASNNPQSQKRYLNALSAWLRNPITLRKFGNNEPRYVRWKGFDWVMVRTGRMFNSVKARLTDV